VAAQPFLLPRDPRQRYSLAEASAYLRQSAAKHPGGRYRAPRRRSATTGSRATPGPIS